MESLEAFWSLETSVDKSDLILAQMRPFSKLGPAVIPKQ